MVTALVGAAFRKSQVKQQLGCNRTRTLEAIAGDLALAAAFGGFDATLGAGLETHEIVPAQQKVSPTASPDAFTMACTPFNAAAGAQKVPRVTCAAGRKRVRDPLRVRRALQVADGAGAPTQAGELVLLHAADDDSAALALRCRQGCAYEFGGEVLHKWSAIRKEEITRRMSG